MRTRVFPWFTAGVMLAGLSFGARPAQAGPILIPFSATPGAGVQTFSGSFGFDNDVVVIRFVLGEGVFSLNALTTSFAAGGFDPYLALYFGTERVTYLNSDGDLTPAENDDTSDVDFDAMLGLTLSGAGEYTLALTQSPNFSQATFGFDFDDFPNFTEEFFPDVDCEVGLPSFGPLCRLPNFSVDLELTRTDTVPEPGTLSLLTIGAAVSALLRRRRTRHYTTTP